MLGVPLRDAPPPEREGVDKVSLGSACSQGREGEVIERGPPKHHAERLRGEVQGQGKRVGGPVRGLPRSRRVRAVLKRCAGEGVGERELAPHGGLIGRAREPVVCGDVAHSVLVIAEGLATGNPGSVLLEMLVVAVPVVATVA